MLETLHSIDVSISLIINNLHSHFLDDLMVLISGRITWIPLYVLLAAVLYRKFNLKGFLISLALFGIGIVLSDQISVLMKYGFERLRPCHNENVSPLLNLPSGCGGQYGFVSSHAANTMCLAMLAISLIRKKWSIFVLLLYAILNSYSRVYLGKHYVGDVIGGMILGFVIARGLYYLYHRFYSSKLSTSK